jgi:hypothetical protein
VDKFHSIIRNMVLFSLCQYMEPLESILSVYKLPVGAMPYARMETYNSA